jgi:hypothetical protein
MQASKAAKTATAPAGGDPHLHVLAVVASQLVDVPGLRADDVLPGRVTSLHPKNPWCGAPSGVW